MGLIVNHGGARAGAGRRKDPSKKVKISIAVDPGLLDRLNSIVKTGSRSSAIEKLIKQYLEET